jgi:hypothetical protein
MAKDGSIMTPEQYNYTTFPPEDDVATFTRFPEYLKIGAHAPDPPLFDLDSGETINLSSFTRRGLTVIEFGSLT